MLVVPAILTIAGCTDKPSDDGSDFAPIVITNAVIGNLTPTSATSGAYLTNFIENTITQYGVCWSSASNEPTINDAKASFSVANTINFEAQVTGLTASTTYHLRGYCIDNLGKAVYGNTIAFTTPSITAATYADVTTFAGTGAPGFTDGASNIAQFSNPQAIAADAQGNFYVADSFNNLIRKIATNGTVSTIAGSTDPGYVNDVKANARFYSPQGIAVDAQGNVYVSDFGNNAIRKITPDGAVSTLAGGNGPGYADGQGLVAKFHNPSGLAVDAQGNIYVADKGNNIIRKITAAGVTSTIAGNTVPGYINAVGTLAQFNSPSGVTLDSKGNIYVADLSNSSIRKITSDGTVSTLAGNPTTTTDLLNLPQSITVDKNDNLFITDESGRILEISTANILYSIAGTVNVAGYTDGSGTDAAFNSPQGITTDAQGNVYVADYNNNVIRKLVVQTTP